jgi:intracellular sulfur oxidation DsrE/DsrF family protein
MEHSESSYLARRQFLRKVGTGVTVFGATAAAGTPGAAAQSTETARWQPTRHAQDDWLDQIPGKHRLVFDTTESGGMSSALVYADNFYTANQSDYGLQNSDLAVVIVARHFSTPFAYSDAIWSKYGEPICNFIQKKEAASTNTYTRQLTGMTGRGMHLAVCQLATRVLAGSIAKAVNGKQGDVFNEIAANLMPNAHLVAAGIVAVNRAQERGYALAHAM